MGEYDAHFYKALTSGTSLSQGESPRKCGGNGVVGSGATGSELPVPSQPGTCWLCDHGLQQPPTLQVLNLRMGQSHDCRSASYSVC